MNSSACDQVLSSLSDIWSWKNHKRFITDIFVVITGVIDVNSQKFPHQKFIIHKQNMFSSLYVKKSWMFPTYSLVFLFLYILFPFLTSFYATTDMWPRYRLVSEAHVSWETLSTFLVLCSRVNEYFTENSLRHEKSITLHFCCIWSKTKVEHL